MAIDWSVIATIAAPIIALFVGIWADRKFENRPVLVSYFGYISAFRSTPPNGQPFDVHSHLLILQNTGRRSATNVRVHHAVLPEFNVSPSVVYRVENLPDGTRDIVIPTLVPGEQIAISYLYYPPLTAQGVNAGIKSDQGFARAIPVLLQRRYPVWVTTLFGFLMLVGAVAVLYFVFLGISRL